MKINELRQKLENENLLTIHTEDGEKQYINGEQVWSDGNWHNAINAFGIYEDSDGKFCLFITDSERGIPMYTLICDSEESACDEILEEIELREYVYKKNLQN